MHKQPKMKGSRYSSWTIIVLILLVNGAFGQSDEDEDDICRLPANMSLIRQRDEEVTISLLDLLQNGTNELFAETANLPRDVIMIMGNTGCGKTTLTKMITGDLSKLHARESATGNLIVIDDERKISSRTTSKTLIPELYSLPERNQSYFDCPGFDDNRGPVNDLAANYFIRQIFSKVSRVKLLFLTHHNSVKLGGNDRSGFDLLAKHATTLVRDLQSFNQSIALIVTNVQTESGHRKRSKPDKQIIDSVVAFLRQYRQDVVFKSERHDRVERYRLKDLKKIEFVDILLQTNHGVYNKITISRGPKYCGPLSNSGEVNETRTRVLYLIENLTYGHVGDPKVNFGFTLKDSTKDEVKSTYTTEVNDEVTSLIRKEMDSVLEWNNLKYNFSVDNFHPDMIRLVWGNLDKFRLPTDQNPSKISSEIISWLNLMGYPEHGEFEKEIHESQAIFDFFDLATGSQVDRRIADWIAIVQLAQDKMRLKMEQKIEDMTKTINDNIVRDVSELMTSLNHTIHNQLRHLNVSSSLVLSQNAFIQLNQIENKIFVDEYATGIADAIGQLTSNHSVQWAFKNNCSRYEAIFAYLETVTHQRLDRSQIRWSKPVEETKKEMYELKTWYEFCAQVELQLSSWEFQRIKPNEINPHDKHWTQFLRTVDKISVSTEVEHIGESLRVKQSPHFIKLKDIVKEAFSLQSIKCQSGDTLVVTGRFIQLGKLLNTDGTINRGPCWEVKNLEIYAAEKLFIDANLQAAGKELVVSFVAPTWEIVSRASINLNGVDGKKYVAAANGRMTTQDDENRFSKPPRDSFQRRVSNGHEDPFNLPSYDTTHYEINLKREFKAYLKNLRRGSDGWPGEPGGPAGSFLGVANNIINAFLYVSKICATLIV